MGYTTCRNIQILLGVLKGHNIRKIIISPGTTNLMLVGSVQDDPWFECYSAPDERSAAYMACGMAAESGEPVCLSCTGATASRNYYPGMTEAYYRKLPVLAITSLIDDVMPGMNIPQVLDRTVLANDTYVYNVSLPAVRSDSDVWKCNLKANEAVLALFKDGGGPVHVQLPAVFSKDFSLQELPPTRIIHRYTMFDKIPEIPADKKVGIFVGEHAPWTKELTDAVNSFCRKYDAIVLCDHTSNYQGPFRIDEAILGAQKMLDRKKYYFDILIDIGGVTGNYYHINGRETWRVSPDGRLSDRFRNMHYDFYMPEKEFFEKYVNEFDTPETRNTAASEYMRAVRALLDTIPEIPFSHVWIAQKYADKLPKNSHLFLGILHSLRAWNFFPVDSSIECFSNVGGFGIDGGTSTMLGAALVHPDQLYFLMVGDLAFFYDMNVLGNRHWGKNCRILLVNNGRGTEFRNYSHPAQQIFSTEADRFMAAAGHYGSGSRTLVKHYAEDLGFKYLAAASKEDFIKVADEFFDEKMSEQPMLLEAFTTPENESDALKAVCEIEKGTLKIQVKKAIAAGLGEKNTKIIKKIIHRG